MPYAMIISDHVGGLDSLDLLIKQDRIELQHLGLIRGRDIKNSIIICSEAENMTKEHVQLLIGRVGENSSLWLNGDQRQVDKQVFYSLHLSPLYSILANIIFTLNISINIINLIFIQIDIVLLCSNTFSSTLGRQYSYRLNYNNKIT